MPVRIIALVLLLFSSIAFSKPFKLDYAVSSVDDQGGIATFQSNFGKGVSRSVTVLADWDGVTFCTDPETGALGVLLVYTDYSSVMNFDTTDQLYEELDPHETSTLCYDFVADTWVIKIHSNIVGGSGKYKDATGSYVVSGRGGRVGTLGQTGGRGSGEGTIDL